jgi:phosphohistidine phosphatase
VPEVEVVLSSGFARAWSTAELLHEVAGWPEPQDCPALEAGRPAAGALDVLGELKQESVALAGHEPHLSMLTSLLCAGSEHGLRFELKKGGVVAVEVDGEVAPGSGRLLWAVTPKILRKLDR